MNYVGKSLDSFEYAFRSLLEVSGIVSLPEINADCLSFRAFAFSFTDNIKECFRPAISWEEYMQKLIRYLGIGDELIVEGCKTFSVERFPENIWVLLGEFPHYWGVETIQNKFYSGCPAYYLCKKYNETEYLISDSFAIPVQIVMKDDVWSKVKAACGFIAYFSRKPTINIISPGNLIADAVEWRNENPELWLKNQKTMIEKLPLIRGSEKYALGYGLMNYQIQVDKVIRFVNAAGCLGRADYQKLLNILYSLSGAMETGNYSVVGEIDSIVWEKLTDWKGKS